MLHPHFSYELALTEPSIEEPLIPYTKALKLLEEMKKYYLTLNPMEEASNFLRLTQHFTKEIIATTLGISRGYIYKRLTLLELLPELQQFVRSGDLAPNTGYELNRKGKTAQETWLSAHQAEVEREANKEEA